MPAEGRDEDLLLRSNSPPRCLETRMRNQSMGLDSSAGKSVAPSPRRETDRVRIITETIVMVALAGALYLIKIFTLPQGGSVTLGSMGPISILALRKRPRIGIGGRVGFEVVP